MMIINNEVIYTDEELAQDAYELLDADSYWGVDRDSFIKGFLLGLKAR